MFSHLAQPRMMQFGKGFNVVMCRQERQFAHENTPSTSGKSDMKEMDDWETAITALRSLYEGERNRQDREDREIEDKLYEIILHVERLQKLAS